MVTCSLRRGGTSGGKMIAHNHYQLGNLRIHPAQPGTEAEVLRCCQERRTGGSEPTPHLALSPWRVPGPGLLDASVREWSLRGGTRSHLRHKSGSCYSGLATSAHIPVAAAS